MTWKTGNGLNWERASSPPKFSLATPLSRAAAGMKKTDRTNPTPIMPAWSQSTLRQCAKVTMIPATRGPIYVLSDELGIELSMVNITYLGANPAS